MSIWTLIIIGLLLALAGFLAFVAKKESPASKSRNDHRKTVEEGGEATKKSSI